MPVPATSIEVRLEQIFEALSGSPYTFVRWDGEYKNARSRLICSCAEHGEFSVSISNLLQGSRCRMCGTASRAAKMRQDPSELEREIKDALNNTPYAFIGWSGIYKNSFSKFSYMCAVHGPKEAIYSNFKTHGIQCKDCWAAKKQHHRRVPKVTRELQIISLMQGTQYSFVQWLPRYSNNESIFIYKCEAHGLQKARVANFINKGKRCPGCARFGFDNSKPGYVYVLISEDGSKIKIGLSNTPKKRIEVLRRQTPFNFNTAEIVEFKNGRDARSAEFSIHTRYKGAKLSGFSGASEWLQFNPGILEELRKL